MVNGKLEWDVLDEEFLRTKGYDKRNYYCGSWTHMALWTKFRGYLRKAGIKFPFNCACFKHDSLYSEHPSIPRKFLIDFTFFVDMCIIILNRSDLYSLRKRLLIRALLYYVIVTIATPFYMMAGLVGKRGDKGSNDRITN